MKKFFIFTVILILCASFLTACGSRAAAPDFIPHWGQLQIDETDNGYLEKSVFVISVKQPEEDKQNSGRKNDEELKYELDPASKGGKYTTVLKRDGEDGKASIYKLTTEFIFEGLFIKTGSPDITINDSYTSEVTFKVTSQSFDTIKSTKNVENYTFVDTEGLSHTVSYEIENEYTNKRVSSKITIKEDPDNVFENTKTTFTANNKSYYFDNESLFFGIRSLTPTENFSLASFSLLEPITQRVSAMKANYVILEEGKNKVALATLNEGENALQITPQITGLPETTTEIDCNLIRAVITGTTYTGAPMDLYYSNDSYKTKYKGINGREAEVPYFFLAKIEHGNMIYTLNTFDNRAQKY